MRMLEWMNDKGIEGECGSAQITQFIGEEFGTDHYLHSLFAYTYAARAVSSSLITKQHPSDNQATLAGAPVAAYSDEEKYVLSREVVLLPDCHNYSAVVSALREHRFDQAEAEALKTDRRNYISTTDKTQPGNCRGFEVSSDARRLLELFREPRSIEQCRSLLRIPEAAYDRFRPFVSDLIERKILIPSVEQAHQVGITFVNSKDETGLFC
jgi:hypothetical protein